MVLELFYYTQQTPKASNSISSLTDLYNTKSYTLLSIPILIKLKKIVLMIL